jgi:hypothetical protein
MGVFCYNCKRSVLVGCSRERKYIAGSEYSGKSDCWEGPYLSRDINDKGDCKFYIYKTFVDIVLDAWDDFKPLVFLLTVVAAFVFLFKFIPGGF